MTPVLVHIPYSPWSGRARHALDAAGIPWRSRVYTPRVSEPWLRWTLGDWRSTISVPVLLTEQGPIRGGREIASWIDGRIGGFVPEGSDVLDAHADAALGSGRILAGHRVLADPAAIEASIPPALRPLGPLARAIVRDAWRGILRKYDPEGRPLAFHAQRQIDALTALEQAVGQRPQLSADTRPTWADITVASALGFVAPDPELRMAEATRAAWGDPALAARFARLVAWRDALNAARPPSQRVRS